MPEYVVLECPFCGKNTISAIFIPASSRPIKGSWGGSKAWHKVTNENYLIQSGCSSCGKTAKEVEKEICR